MNNFELIPGHALVTIPPIFPSVYANCSSLWVDWVKGLDGEIVTLEQKDQMTTTITGCPTWIRIDGWNIKTEKKPESPCCALWLPSGWLSQPFLEKKEPLKAGYAKVVVPELLSSHYLEYSQDWQNWAKAINGQVVELSAPLPGHDSKDHGWFIKTEIQPEDSLSSRWLPSEWLIQVPQPDDPDFINVNDIVYVKTCCPCDSCKKFQGKTAQVTSNEWVEGPILRDLLRLKRDDARTACCFRAANVVLIERVGPLPNPDQRPIRVTPVGILVDHSGKSWITSPSWLGDLHIGCDLCKRKYVWSRRYGLLQPKTCEKCFPLSSTFDQSVPLIQPTPAMARKKDQSEENLEGILRDELKTLHLELREATAKFDQAQSQNSILSRQIAVLEVQVKTLREELLETSGKLGLAESEIQLLQKKKGKNLPDKLGHNLLSGVLSLILGLTICIPGLVGIWMTIPIPGCKNLGGQFSGVPAKATNVAPVQTSVKPSPKVYR